MDFFVFLKPCMHTFRNVNSHDKRNNRNQIPYAMAKFAPEQIAAHQYNIAGLSVCENLTAADICICILKPPDRIIKTAVVKESDIWRFGLLKKDGIASPFNTKNEFIL